MAIIDSQVHAYEANTPKRLWHSVPNWPAHVTGDEMVAAMRSADRAGEPVVTAAGGEARPHRRGHAARLALRRRRVPQRRDVQPSVRGVMTRREAPPYRNPLPFQQRSRPC